MQTRKNDPLVPLPRDLLTIESPGLTKLELFSILSLNAILQRQTNYLTPDGLSETAIALANSLIKNLNLEASWHANDTPGLVSESWREAAAVYHCAIQAAATILADLDSSGTPQQWGDRLRREGWALFQSLSATERDRLFSEGGPRGKE